MNKTTEQLERMAKARVHYETRADRRPKQVWSPNAQRWVKSDEP